MINWLFIEKSILEENEAIRKKIRGEFKNYYVKEIEQNQIDAAFFDQCINANNVNQNVIFIMKNFDKFYNVEYFKFNKTRMILFKTTDNKKYWGDHRFVVDVVERGEYIYVIDNLEKGTTSLETFLSKFVF